MVYASVRAIIPGLKLVDYIPVQTHKPDNNIHMMTFQNEEYTVFLIVSCSYFPILYFS